MGKQFTMILKKRGIDVSSKSEAPAFFRPKLLLPEQQRRENERKQKENERWAAIRRAERERREQEVKEKIRKEEENNRPLPKFPRLIQFDLRVDLLYFIRRVFSDGVKNACYRDELDILKGYCESPEYYGADEVREARESLKRFKDIPVQDFSIAVRVSTLKKPFPGVISDTVSILYVYCARGGFIYEHVAGRLQRNLIKNIPQLKSVLGDKFEIQISHADREFSELKKFGYKADPREERVTHLEIFGD